MASVHLFWSDVYRRDWDCDPERESGNARKVHFTLLCGRS